MDHLLGGDESGGLVGVGGVMCGVGGGDVCVFVIVAVAVTVK